MLSADSTHRDLMTTNERSPVMVVGLAGEWVEPDKTGLSLPLGSRVICTCHQRGTNK